MRQRRGAVWMVLKNWVRVGLRRPVLTAPKKNVYHLGWRRVSAGHGNARISATDKVSGGMIKADITAAVKAGRIHLTTQTPSKVRLSKEVFPKLCSAEPRVTLSANKTSERKFHYNFKKSQFYSYY
jgi:hypothetical protein